jgi:hypothetical protein
MTPESTLEELHAELPDLALAAEDMIHASLIHGGDRREDHPERLKRILQAALIVRRAQVQILRRNHCLVQSDQNPLTRFSVWWSEHENSYCQCPDWFKGNQFYNYHLPRQSYAPKLPGLGIACKHVLAAHLALAITPLWDCPDCAGQGFFMIEHPTDATGRPLYGRTQTHYCDPCTLCRGKGILFIDPDQLPPTGPAPQDPSPPPLDPAEIQALILDDEKRNLFCR